MIEKTHTLAGMKIGLFGKGGSGKSTVTALLAKELAAHGSPDQHLQVTKRSAKLRQSWVNWSAWLCHDD